MSLDFENAFALIIGVGGTDIPVTIQDAKSVGELLVDPHRASYKSENVVVITGEESNRSNVLNSLKNIVDKSQESDDATVIIYYSGHGGVYQNEGSDEYYLLTHGFDLNDKNNTMVNGEEFSSLINQVKAKRLLVLLDCCHASGIIQVKSSFEKGSINDSSIIKSNKELINKLNEGSGRIYLASCKDEEESIILSDDELSLFTKVVIEALSGKAGSENGFVRAIEFLSYVMINVEKSARKVNHLQTPIINAANQLSSDYYLCKAKEYIESLEDEQNIDYADQDRYKILLDFYEKGAAEAEILEQFPTGPMVDIYEVGEEIISEFARTIDREKALVVVRRANRLRKTADPLDATIIDEIDLINPNKNAPFDFWHAVFDEACRHGPRMLAAILLSVPDSRFRALPKKKRNALLNYLKTYN